MARQARKMTAARLRRLIAGSGLTRERFAREVGVSRRTVQRWIAGDTPVSPSHAKLIRLVLAGIDK